MLTLYILAIILSLGALVDIGLIALNLKVASKHVRIIVIKKIMNRIIFIAFVLSWVVTLELNLQNELGVYLVFGLIGYIIIIEGLFVQLSHQGLKTFLMTLMIYFIVLAIYWSVMIVFFGIIHPILLGIMVLLSIVIIRYILIPRIIRKIDKKFRLVPYRHGLPPLFFEGLVDPTKVYMIDGDKLSLGLNAMLLDAGKTRAMYISRSLLSSMDSQMVEGIMAHEMGHAVNRHMIKRIRIIIPLVVLFIVVNIVFFQILIEQMNAYYFWTIVIFTTFLLIRIFKWIIITLLQKQEFEADAFAKQKGYSSGLTKGLKKIEKRTDEKNYHPIYTKIHRSHPSIQVRVRTLMK